MSFTDESWLAVQVERVLEQEETRHLNEQFADAMAQVREVLHRAERVRDLRAELGKDLSGRVRQQLEGLHAELLRLQSTLTGGNT